MIHGDATVRPASSTRDADRPATTFLTAEWRYLAMLNYAAPAELLRPLVPAGTELDTWRGQTIVSLVGFLFRDARLGGVPLPFHRDFEEVNLRFYVRRDVDGEHRRGVVFIREIVPRLAIAAVARWAYNEPYVTLPMRHRITAGASPDTPAAVEYGWRQRSGWNGLRVEPTGPPHALVDGSEEEFITEHYWGYTRQRDGRTVEYRVEHPRWRVWSVGRAEVDGDLTPLYGAGLTAVLRQPPVSVFLADGSAVVVRAPQYLAV